MKNEKLRKLIFIIVYLAYSAIYIARVNLSMASPALVEHGVLDEAGVGLLGSVFSCVYAIGRLINGGISDKRPPWQMLTAGLAAAGICNIAFSFFPPFIGLFLLWAGNAWAQSMLWSSVLCVVSSVYGKDKAPSRASLMVTSVAAGNVLGIVVNTLLIKYAGAWASFAVPGILTLVLGAGVLLTTHKVGAPQAQSAAHISFFSLLKNGEVLTMGFSALLHGVVKENVTLWMAMFVVSRYQTDLTSSAYYILLIPVVGLVGRLCYTFVFRLCRGNEHTVSLISYAICAAASALICLPGIGMILAVVSLSFIYASVSMINTSIVSMYPLSHLKSGNVASVSGIMDLATYIGAGVSGAIYGVVVKYFGYTPMFLSWIAVSALAIAVTVFFKRKYTKNC